MRTSAITAAASLLVLQACTNDMGTTSSASSSASSTAATATAALADASGAARGTATISESGGGLRVVASLSGMAPGSYGVHFHTTGRCDAPDFASAGPHWNPAQKKHGTENPEGPHAGDLPNLTVGADGSGRLDTVLAGATLATGTAPLLDADGAALMLHAAADDYRTDPSGNSGARILCGVVSAG